MSPSTQSIAPPRSAKRTLHAREVAWTTTVVYALTAIIVQWLHPRFDWLQAPLSFYLSGPHGLWLQLAYGLLALGISSLAWALLRELPRNPAQWLSSLILWTGAVALVLTALFPGGSPEHSVSPEMHRLHGLFAWSAFGFTGLGLLLQATIDWRCGLRAALPLALLTWVVLIVGHWPDLLPRGLGQKIAVLCYLYCLAWRSRRFHADPAAA